MKSIIHIIPVLVLLQAFVHAQSNPNFNVNLLLDYTAAEQTIQLLADRYVNTQALVELRGNRIAASTTGLIENDRLSSLVLQYFLDSLKYHQIIKKDIYHLEDSRKNVFEINQLLEEMKKRNFNRRVVATVEQIFPQQTNINVTIPVYIVALGHENVDAYVRRIIWHGDIPQFVGEEEGELTIVVNLSHAVNYGNDLEERFVNLLGVVAHEVFHAAYGAYKNNSSAWKEFYRNHQKPFDVLLDLTQNEGIAYYLSLDQSWGGRVPRDWNSRTRDAFRTFNNNANELLSEKISPKRASELIRNANLSGYKESYGSMTGMFIAREIDLHLGRSALIAALSSNPYIFFQKYIELAKQDSNLPTLSEKIILAILEK